MIEALTQEAHEKLHQNTPNYFFEEDIIKACVLGSVRKRLWAAWKVLKGDAGIVLLKINPRDFYKSNVSPK